MEQGPFGLNLVWRSYSGWSRLNIFQVRSNFAHHRSVPLPLARNQHPIHFGHCVCSYKLALHQPWCQVLRRHWLYSRAKRMLANSRAHLWPRIGWWSCFIHSQQTFLDIPQCCHLYCRNLGPRHENKLTVLWLEWTRGQHNFAQTFSEKNRERWNGVFLQEGRN